MASSCCNLAQEAAENQAMKLDDDAGIPPPIYGSMQGYGSAISSQSTETESPTTCLLYTSPSPRDRG
eukprot:5514068-Amphidinium_carterae.1